MSKAKGAIVIVVGGQDSGKTAWILDQLRRSARWKFIYDDRREYAQRLGTKQTTLFYNLDSFYSFIPHFHNASVVLEEATNFVDGHSKKDIISMVTGIYHEGNIMYLVFHTLEDVPNFLINKSHLLVLFKTADQPLQVKTKHPSYYHYLLKPERPLFIKIQDFG